jgi:hypothetical protein
MQDVILSLLRNVRYHFIRYVCPVRLNLSARLISHGTIFFSHNKTAVVGLSAAFQGTMSLLNVVLRYASRLFLELIRYAES